MKFSTTILAMILSVLYAGNALAAPKIYKWTDEKGEVHYSTTPPPETREQAHDVLDDKGITRQQRARAKSDAEVAVEVEATRLKEEEAAREQKRNEALARMRQMYPTEEDISRTRRGKLEGVDRTIEVTEAQLTSLEKQLRTLRKQAAERERSGRSVSKTLQSSIDSLIKQIDRQHDYIRRKEGEKTGINSKFDEILSEYRRLQKSGERASPANQVTP